MSDDYEQYERTAQAIRKENAALLTQFAGWLSAKGLSKRSVQKHSANIDFYINEFLLYDDVTSADQGVSSAGMFLGFWFIRKAMWASQSSIRSNAASLKKFYQFMFETARINEKDLQELKAEIKQELPGWLAAM
jgi:hypothetical protein